jgi:hypothetical protein
MILMIESLPVAQCFGSALDPHPIADWIRIRIPNADLGPGGLKRAIKKGEKRIQNADN